MRNGSRPLPRLDKNPSREDAIEIIKEEVGVAFSEILECAGVYKRDEEGMNSFMRFVSSL